MLGSQLAALRQATHLFNLPAQELYASDRPSRRIGLEKVERIRTTVLIPVFDDWEACEQLISGLNDAFQGQPVEVNLLIVDDGSAYLASPRLPAEGLDAIRTIEILRLKRNLGHQRAIGIGLAHAQSQDCGDAVIVMDGDGQDLPRDALRLLDRCREEDWQKIIFAERARRSEGWLFKSCYLVYRLLHRLLTGQKIRVGNFSVIPAERLKGLVIMPELWNHYAAAVFNSRLPYSTLKTDRAKRLDGISKMNYVNLVVHGLSAISVFGEVVGTRLLIFCGISMGVLGLGFLAVVGIRLFTDLAVPGWATYTTGFLAALLAQIFVLATVFSLIILDSRSRMEFLPLRDHHLFVDRLETLLGGEPGPHDEPSMRPASGTAHDPDARSPE